MINVVYLNMEYGIHEQVTHNHDGSYTVFLNARDSDAMNRTAFIHALYHIRNHDFEKSDVQEIEYEAHKNSAPGLGPQDGWKEGM